LARQLGVSYLTARRANEELIREGLIRREHGRGTFVIRSTRQRSGPARIGFLGVSRELEGYTLNHFTNLRSALKNLEQPHRMVFDHVDPDEGDAILPQQFRDGGVDVVVCYGIFNHALMRRLAEVAPKLIIIGNTVSEPNVPVINIDFKGMVFDLVRLLVEQLHYEDIWLVADPFRAFSTREFVEGYRDAMERGLIDCELLSLCDGGNYLPFIRSYSRFSRLLNTRQAVIWQVASPMVSLGLLDEHPESGRFSVVNYGPRSKGWTLAREFDHGSLSIPWDSYAQEIIRMIGELLDTDKTHGRTIVPHLSVVDRDGQPQIHAEYSVRVNGGPSAPAARSTASM